ncbi:sensor domain-containing diguanylate cyclase [Sutcliffiella sp. NC1]|uniref:sensor domain-containing diguanylate cyclase n=1 Tax=Sutcliffiella sp. NC1 TaxID=3004096 RepID=UPI0022DDD315|nr:sensor domain-containing diguanylate cyclase [Sutcliffiella sp. NC1]WBL14474.1 sensor domain-containing diguanylate cyclase [Sutcliffiella sp. NC1]
MKYKGRIVALSIWLILLLSFVLIVALNIELNRMVKYISVFLLLIPAWFIGNQFDRISFYMNQLNVNKQQLDDKNRLLESSKKEIDEIYENLHLMYFSYNPKKNKMSVSKGIELISGYTKDDFSANFILWRELVHQEDKEKVSEKLEQLFLGKSISNLQHRIIDSNEEVRWVSLNANILYDDEHQDVQKIVGTVTDISEQKQLEDKLRHLAYYDNLTNLPNRLLLHNHLKRAKARAKRNNHNLTILFMDLDGFKQVNDTLGHDVGDLLLKEVAYRLENCVREEDLISRIGGDEFIIVLEETDNEDVRKIAERIVSAISERYDLNGNKTEVTPSIGISVFPEHGEEIEVLLKNADKAMYAAKNNGKAQYVFYETTLENFQLKKSIFEKILSAFQRN